MNPLRQIVATISREIAPGVWASHDRLECGHELLWRPEVGIYRRRCRLCAGRGDHADEVDEVPQGPPVPHVDDEGQEGDEAR